MLWSTDPEESFKAAFGATLRGIVNDINIQEREKVATPITPLAARLKDVISKHVAPLPGKVSGLIDRVETVGERAGVAINNAHDAIGVAEGLLAQVEEAHAAVNEILQVIPDAAPEAQIPMPLLVEQPVAVAVGVEVPLPPMAAPGALLPGWVNGPNGPVWAGTGPAPIADAGGRGDHPSQTK